MRNTILVLFVLLAGAQPGAPPRGVAAKFETACEKANEGKRLMLEGYLDFPEHGFDDAATSVLMRLRPSLASWEFTVAANVKLGKGTNTVEMPPSNYKNRDLKLHLTDGQIVGYSNKVKVSGTMYYVTSLGQGAYTCGLSNTLLERGGGYQPAAPK